MIDLMGAPGFLIPSEAPSSQLQDIRSVAPVMDTVSNSCSEFGGGSGTILSMPGINEAAKASSSAPEPSFAGIKPHRDCVASESSRRELFEHEFGNIVPSLVKIPEESAEAVRIASTAQKIQVENVSKIVVSAAKDPEFAQKLHAILLQNSESQLLDSSPNLSPHNAGEPIILHKSQLLEGERMVDAQLFPLTCLSHNEGAVIPFTGVQLFKNVSPPSRESAQGIAVQKEEVASSVPNPGDRSSCVHDGFVLASGRPDHGIQGDDVLKRMKAVASGRQTSPCTTRDEQIDPLLGGVSGWEIPWDDLQIGERIGIGTFKNYSCLTGKETFLYTATS